MIELFAMIHVNGTIKKIVEFDKRKCSMLMESIQKNIGEEIKGLGITKVLYVYSKLGGVCECDYMDMMGMPITLTQAVEIFNDTEFHCGRLTLENNWEIHINREQGFRKLVRLNKPNQDRRERNAG